MAVVKKGKPELESEPPDDQPMTVFEHLGELRTRLIRSLLGIIPGITVAWIYHQELLDFLVAPLAKAWVKLGGFGKPALNFAGVADPFIAYIRISVICGLIFSSPWIAYQMWAFIAPGLYSREKLYAIPFAL